jgi:hypothetical protein
MIEKRRTKHARLTYQAKSLPLQHEFKRVARLTPSYAAKDTIFWQKRPKTIVIRIIVQDNKNSNLFTWPSMGTRLEHAHCLETINNMLGKRERRVPIEGHVNRFEFLLSWTIILITIVLGLFCQKIISFAA